MRSDSAEAIPVSDPRPESDTRLAVRLLLIVVLTVVETGATVAAVVAFGLFVWQGLVTGVVDRDLLAAASSGGVVALLANFGLNALR